MRDGGIVWGLRGLGRDEGGDAARRLLVWDRAGWSPAWLGMAEGRDWVEEGRAPRRGNVRMGGVWRMMGKGKM